MPCQFKFMKEVEEEQDIERELGKFCKQGEPMKEKSDWLKQKTKFSCGKQVLT